MTAPLLVPLPRNETLARALAGKLGLEVGSLETRRFPDGETYLRYASPPAARAVILICTLDRPDERIVPLLFAAGAARALGATRVGLVAPYLAYMRQDRRFHDGEAITSVHFAELLSRHLDCLITVDPHLHRRKDLGEIYSIPTVTLHAMPVMADWIHKHVDRPLIIGPDSESEQWVAEVARSANAPFVILEKARHGDRDVEISVPIVERWRYHTPVLVDDIISTAHTMIETIRRLRSLEMKPPVCVGIHGVFSGDSLNELKAAGASHIVTTTTIPNVTSEIDVSDLLANAIRSSLPPPKPSEEGVNGQA